MNVRTGFSFCPNMKNDLRGVIIHKNNKNLCKFSTNEIMTYSTNSFITNINIYNNYKYSSNNKLALLNVYNSPNNNSIVIIMHSHNVRIQNHRLPIVILIRT